MKAFWAFDQEAFKGMKYSLRTKTLRILPMPVGKIHLLEDQYSEARLDKVSNAIQ